MSSTRQWYEEHGRLGEYYLAYVCPQCKYHAFCGTGQLNIENRINCEDFIERSSDENPQRAHWTEMSYYALSAVEHYSMARRLRNG